MSHDYLGPSNLKPSLPHTHLILLSLYLSPTTYLFLLLLHVINTYRIDCVLETVLSTLYIISHSTPIQPCEVETINIPIFQMGKLWLKVA